MCFRPRFQSGFGLQGGYVSSLTGPELGFAAFLFAGQRTARMVLDALENHEQDGDWISDVVVVARTRQGHVRQRLNAVQTRSSAIAMPWPTPIHMVARARLAPRSASSSAAVPVILAPDIPSG